VLRRDSYRDEAIAAGKWPDPFVSVMVDRVPQANGGEMPMIRYGVTQMLPWPGKLSLMRLAVERQGEGAGAELDTRRLDLRFEAERAYLMLWMNAKRREVNRAQRALASTITSAALGRYGAGIGEHHEVARAQVEINALDIEHINLEGERASIVAMLNALRNQPSDLAFADPVDVTPPATTLALGPLVDKAVANRPELRRMKAMQNESEAMAAFSRREPYPDIMTGIWANQMIGGPPTMGGMIGFTIPVFGASRGSHRGSAFDARASGAAEDAEGMRAMIRAEVADALVKVQTATRQLDLIESIALPKAHESFDAALARYGASTLDIVGVLDAQRALQSAELFLIDARVRRALAEAELEHAIGGKP
jgi:outer membrane protein TolC